MPSEVPRGWMPYRMAAREYLHIDDADVLKAIKSGELPAFRKPMKPGSKYERIFVSTDDVDAWIRGYWEPYKG